MTVSVLLICRQNYVFEKWSTALSGRYVLDFSHETDALDSHYQLVIIEADYIDQGRLNNQFIKEYSGRILVVGENWPDSKQIKIMTSGAAGYCEITANKKVIQIAVERILQGDIWMKRHLVPKVITELVKIANSNITKIAQSPKQTSIDLTSLSIREHEVVELVKKGFSNKLIASELDITERTVKAHMTSIFRKLDIPDRFHLAALFKNGKVELTATLEETI